MKVEARDNTVERLILIAMIVDEKSLSRIAPKWTRDDMMRSEWCSMIGGWCVRHWQRYKDAPGKIIESIYEAWAESSKNKDLIASIGRLLSSFSGDYERLKEEINSPDYIIDLAGKHFNEVRLYKFKEKLEGDLEAGKIDDAWTRVNNLRKLELGVGEGIDVMGDKEIIREAFSDPDDGIIKFEGPLGHFYGNEFAREAFVSFMGPQKRGKSFFLQDIAWRGLLSRLRVAYFQLGDLSRRQMIRRFGVRGCEVPRRPGKIRYPISMRRRTGDPFAEVIHQEMEYKEYLTWQRVYKTCQDIMRLDVKSKEVKLRLSCHAANTLTIAGVASILQGWEYELDWVADVVVLDYADILAPTPGINDKREAINDVWVNLRALATKQRNLVVTATQAKATSYGVETLNRSHFSEDARKFSHVTAMFGLNQTRDEKKQGILRINRLSVREDDYDEVNCVHVAGCLGIANPCILSCW